MRRTRLAILLMGALSSVAGDASAFCRTMTCKCKSDVALPRAASGLPQSTCGLPDGDCPRDEHGCVTKGKPVAWPGKCVGYSPNLVGTAQLSDEEWRTAFQEAFHAWQLADCGGGKHPSIQLFGMRATNCAESKYNSDGPNVNSVYFTDTGWKGPQTIENLDHTLARAQITFLPSGDIVDGDIAINSARKEFTVADPPEPVSEDLVSVLTHEVGHFLGLAHSDDRASVMYWEYAGGSIRRELQKDDIEAICTVYPPEREAGCDQTPTGGFQDSCGSNTSVEPLGCSAARDVPDASGVTTSAFGVLGFVVVKRVVERMRRVR